MRVASCRLLCRMATVHRALLSMLLVICGASQCWAHQKWLWPNVFVSKKAPVWVSFDVTWSDKPFAAETGVGDQPLWVVDPTGRRESPPQVFIGKTKSAAEIEITKEGTYRLEAIDPLTYWTRIKKEGQQQWLKKPKNEVRNAKITRSDLYWGKALAYVTVGEPTDLPPPDKADPLDIVPATHPNQTAAGSTIELHVLSYGKPVPSAEIKVFGPDTTGHDPTQTVQCDDQGAGKLQVDMPGRYLVSCQVDREVADDPKADIHSFNVYLTLSIQPRQE